MSDPTTSFGAMQHVDCDRVEGEGLGELYLLGRLDEARRNAFEQHYFACERCFDRLETLRALQLELAPVPYVSHTRVGVDRRRSLNLLALAASLVIVAGLGWWLVGRSGPLRTAAQGTAIVGREPSQARTPPVHATPAKTLAALAAFEPPAYTVPRLRGAQDESEQAFRLAMTRYSQGDYHGAIPGLTRALDIDPRATHIRFYRGIALLMDGRTVEGIHQLRATVAMGDTAFIEDAHFYLAKAYLREGDIAQARQEITRVIALDGDRRAEAARLLADLESIRPGDTP